MGFKHLSINERIGISIYLEQGYSIKSIAQFLNRTFVTIYREIKRNSVDGVYQAKVANDLYEQRKKNKIYYTKLTPGLKEYIEMRLTELWSPEQIAGRLKYLFGRPIISFKSIYRWFHDKKLLGGQKIYLRRKGKSYNYRGILGKIKGAKSIHDREQVIDDRSRIGDWEVDTVMSPKTDKACLVSMVDRKSRFLKAGLVPSHTAAVVNSCIFELLKDEPRKSITSDNGKEFSKFEWIENELNIGFYFCDPGACWQRGTNENTNGLLREFFPKGTNFSKVSKAALLFAVNMINNRPCKIHGFKTRFEVYRE